MIKIVIINKGEVIQERESTTLDAAKLQARRNEPKDCGRIVIWDGRKVHTRKYYRGIKPSRWTSCEPFEPFDRNLRRIIGEEMSRWSKHEQYFTGE